MRTERDRERARIVWSFDLLDIPEKIRAEILEALDSDVWDWFRDCDGCTGVSGIYWPTKYFPPCLRHDYDWRIRVPGTESTARFYRIQRAYGMGAPRAALRAVGVLFAWYCWGRFRR